MTIEKGRAWGRPTDRRPDRVAADDTELAALALAAPGPDPPLLAVRTGDVRRNLGLTAPPGPDHTGVVRDDALAFPFDLGLVQLDDGPVVPFVAHVAAHRARWSGPFAVVCNVGWLGRWYVGPRAHPNDGLLDIIHGTLPLRQRLEARRRVLTGTHLPHPALTTRRAPRWEHRFDRPVPVMADGVRVGAARELRLELRPDAFSVLA